ncbi:DNA-binding protein [Streptomyces sp. NBC_00306]|uniref:DNA-binding protein n=1 Tax=Streptomyces sp. NBC_00306 TaxID=2975708 RepID=UPI002E2D6EC0|nr:DNA-binding protein [Streptomyces sp. NBC_00306]
MLIDQQMLTWSSFEPRFRTTAERILGDQGRNVTLGESQFRRWTSGQLKTLPNPDACRVLEAMFDRKAVHLFDPPDEDGPASLDVPAHDLEAEIAMTAHEAQTDASEMAAASVSDVTVEQLQDDVHDLARSYTKKSPQGVWQEAKLLREKAEHGRERTAVPAQQQVLLILAGKASALLAQAAFDLGQLDGARRLARTAALYGETARYEPLRAFAAGSLAYIAYYSGEPSQALAHVRRALTYGGLGDVANRRLRAIEARAFGHLGDVTSAQRTMAMAQTVDAGASDELHDDVGGEFGFSHERLAMSNASTALLVDDGHGAEESARHALDLVSSQPPRQQSTTVIGKASADLAMARLLSGDIDGAADALQAVFSVPGDQRVTGLVSRAAAVRRFLTRPSLSSAQRAIELGEQLEDFTRLSPQRLLVAYEPLAIEA